MYPCLCPGWETHECGCICCGGAACREMALGGGGGAALTGLRVFGVQFDENCVPTQDSLLMQATAGFIFIPLHYRWAPSGTHPLLLASPPSPRAEWSFINDCKDGSGCGSEGTCLWAGGQGRARGVIREGSAWSYFQLPNGIPGHSLLSMPLSLSPSNHSSGEGSSSTCGLG